jgi:hypothetical protein
VSSGVLVIAVCAEEKPKEDHSVDRHERFIYIIITYRNRARLLSLQGLEDVDIVALSGAHTLGRAYKARNSSNLKPSYFSVCNPALSADVDFGSVNTSSVKSEETYVHVDGYWL